MAAFSVFTTCEMAKKANSFDITENHEKATPVTPNKP